MSMSRQLVLRLTRPATYPRSRLVSPAVSRKLSTTSSLSSQAQSDANQKTQHAHPQGSNTLIILSGLGALGGLYYYYSRGQPAIDREAARRKEEEARQRVREISEAGRSKAESVTQEGQRGYDQAKTVVQDATSAARADLADRARQSSHEVQVKYDELKNSAERKIDDVRGRAERKIEEDKEEVAHKAHEAKSKARGWFGWGGSK